MLTDRRFHGLLLIFFLNCPVIAQTNLDSPYSRYGLGHLARPGFERNRAMGGVGLGLRNATQLDYLNPASYSAIDSMSFLFDLGILNTFQTNETNELKTSYVASNMDHLAIGFPLTRWWAASVGILPYSKVGYYIKEGDYDPDIGYHEYFFLGSGGINQLYLGTSFDLFDALSVGANFKYLFGSIRQIRGVEFPDKSTYSYPEIDSQIMIKDFLIDFGLQYHKSLNERFDLTLGIIFDNKTRLSAENKITKRNVFNGNASYLNDSTLLNTEYILEESSREGKIVIPYNIGTGFSLEYNDRLVLGVDYYRQDWTDFSIFNIEQSLTESSSVHAGLQYIPNPRAFRGYYNLIYYRLGGHYGNTYFQLKGEQIKDYGISFGAGLPLIGFKSSFNLACELGRRGTLENSLVRENYMFISFSVILHDIWFSKQKID